MEPTLAVMHQAAQLGAHAATARTSSGSGSGSGSSGCWWSDAANNEPPAAMDAWQPPPASPTSFLLADGCPLPPFASPTYQTGAAEPADAADLAAIFRRGSSDSTSCSLPRAQSQEQDAYRLRAQPMRRQRSAGEARSSKSRRAENNRRAQQRWRDRQKERSQAAAAEIEHLQRQLREASLAQELLARRNATLEQLLSLRAATAAQYAVADAAADAAPTEQERQQQLVVFRGRMPAEQQETAWWLDAATQAQLAAELGLAGDMVFTVRGDAPLVATQAQVAAMPHQEWGELYQQYLNAMAGCLVAIQEGGDDDEAAAAAARLEVLAGEVTRLKLSILLQHPNQEVALRQRSAGSVAQEAAALGHGGLRQLMSFEYRWKLLEGARLSAGQLEAMKAVRRQYLGNVAALSARRDALEAVLQQDPMAYDDVGTAFGRMQQAIAGIGETLCLEHACLLKAVAAVFSALSAQQFAHMNVGATPAHPNAMCIAETLAVVDGEPHARELVRQLRRAGQPALQLASIEDAVPQGIRREPQPPPDLAALYPTFKALLAAPAPDAGHPAAAAPAASPFAASQPAA